MGTRRRSLLFLGVVCPLAVVAGCRCSSPPRAQTDAAAATPTAVPASTPPARGPASNPVASQASDEAMIAQYRERLNGLARGRTDVGSLWGDASSFAAARARREEYAAHPEKVLEVLGDGAQRARRKASEVLRRAQEACGVKAPS